MPDSQPVKIWRGEVAQRRNAFLESLLDLLLLAHPLGLCLGYRVVLGILAAEQGHVR
jgi:hypothetical protein